MLARVKVLVVQGGVGKESTNSVELRGLRYSGGRLTDALTERLRQRLNLLFHINTSLSPAYAPIERLRRSPHYTGRWHYQRHGLLVR
jgi:hypothetical protein